MLRHWQAVQKDAADARLLHELQLTHQADLHHRKMFGLRSLHGWALAADASRLEAAAQARRDATWGKIQQWLAEDTGGQTSAEAIMAPPFLQVTCCLLLKIMMLRLGGANLLLLLTLCLTIGC